MMYIYRSMNGKIYRTFHGFYGGKDSDIRDFNNNPQDFVPFQKPNLGKILRPKTARRLVNPNGGWAKGMRPN